MDYQQAPQDQHSLSGEADGRTITDYRPLQAPTGRQAGVWQDELLVDVQETENGDDSLWDREIHKLPLWTALIRNLGAFKRHAYRERKPSVGSYEHRHDTDLRQNNEPETQQRPDDAGRQTQYFIQEHKECIVVSTQNLQSRKTND